MAAAACRAAPAQGARRLGRPPAAPPAAASRHRCITIAAAAAAAAAAAGDGAAAPSPPARFAVVGGGLAGVAVAWHLLRRAPRGRAVHLDLYEAAGIGAGGSGAAAGLVHPFTPRGKVLWRGEEALADAFELISAAEAAAAAEPQPPSSSDDGGDAGAFVWRHGLVRPAATPKQAEDFRKAVASGSGSQPLQALSAEQLQELVPGIAATRHSPRQQQQHTHQHQQPATTAPAMKPLNRRARRSAAAAASTPHAASAAAVDTAPGSAADPVPAAPAALLIPQGVVLDVGRYLRALWRACQAEAAARADGSSATLLHRRVASLEHLHWGSGGGGGSGRYDAVVVAAGAAAGTVREVATASLPLQLCQGLTLVMRPRAELAGGSAVAGAAADGAGEGAVAAAAAAGQEAPPAGYPAGSPSLLGSTYLAAQGRRQVVVGATKTYGWSAEAALGACMRSEYAAQQQQQLLLPGPGGEAVWIGAAAAARAERPGARHGPAGGGDDANEEATQALLSTACGIWRPLAAWRVAAVREGVRALPPRTSTGSLPLLGRISPGAPWWLVGGLGSRGLVYHGLLARLTADAVLRGEGEAALPPELLAWRRVAAGAAQFDAP